MVNKRRFLDSRRGPTTYVTPETSIVGTINGNGDYIFCGSVEGDCHIEGTVTLAAGGVWKGTMNADDLVISGTVEGDVCAKHRVEVSGTARVSGSLAGHSIAVAEGAIIEGEINVQSGEEPVRFKEKRSEKTE